MKLVNRFVLVLLRSPLRRLLSGAVVGIEYRGRRSGNPVRFPAQYARSGDAVVVLAGRADTKTWWHNFATPWHATLLLDGERHDAVGEVLREPGPQDPNAMAYRARYPRVGELPVLVVFEPVSPAGPAASAAPSPAG